MSGVTEIYVCKPGQELKEGTLETSTRISTKEDAECDAVQRCKLEPSIDRIAYYAVDHTGTFKCFFMYKNPRPSRLTGKGAAPPRSAPAKAAPPPPLRRPKRPPTLYQRVRALFEVD